jgi:IclR family acetate operon transcriptional repressor
MTTRETKKPATTIQSVSRAARILLAVAASDGPLTPKDIASQFDLTLPTTYHLLATLEMEGLLAKDARRTYALGPAASVIADALGQDYVVPERHLRRLQELARRTGEAVYLSAWRRGSIRVLAAIEGSHAVGVTSLRVGYAENLHARASSKLLLAFASPELRDTVIANLDFVPLTPHTISNREDFLAELDTIRAARISFDRGEFADGVECVSAPIMSGGSVIACYTIQVPMERFRQKQGELVAILKHAAEQASR